MIFSARFIGTHGSCGYKKGVIYTIEVNPPAFWKMMMHGINWEIYRIKGDLTMEASRRLRIGYVPYSDWNTFLNNWQIVKVIDKLNK